MPLLVLWLVACTVSSPAHPPEPPSSAHAPLPQPAQDPLQSAIPHGLTPLGAGGVHRADLLDRGRTDVVMFLQSEQEPDKVWLAVFVQDATRDRFSAPTLVELTRETFRYDDHVPLEVKDRVITYKHQSMRHDWQVKFRYEQKIRDFAVIGFDRNFYGIEGSIESVNYLIGKRVDSDGDTKKTRRFVVDPLPSMKDFSEDWNDPSADPARKL